MPEHPRATDGPAAASNSQPRHANEGSNESTNASNVAAFFDLDKTIIATSSAMAYGREFFHSGLLSSTDALQMSVRKLAYLTFGHNAQQMEATRRHLLKLVAGWDVAQVQEIAASTVHTVLAPAIYQEARELLDWHRQCGHTVVIVSASVRDLVEPIARELGVAGVIASELGIADGRYTGSMDYFCKAHNKAESMRNLAHKEGFDLAKSYAYSDSATDIPMLEAVGIPVAVNPDAALRKHAAANHWRTLTFRKPKHERKP